MCNLFNAHETFMRPPLRLTRKEEQAEQLTQQKVNRWCSLTSPASIKICCGGWQYNQDVLMNNEYYIYDEAMLVLMNKKQISIYNYSWSCIHAETTCRVHATIYILWRFSRKIRESHNYIYVLESCDKTHVPFVTITKSRCSERLNAMRW